ncbi:phosphoserine phosphatase SerB [Sphingomonas sp.]|uniref:phosphoserine phosphatase SerB n=1 Tax=Sphingomonas sp. TaxID=28214 RepID=UPI00286C4DA3|nr:phosphoserine phosphatase SerB [Sphingomonas sp.]
MTIATLIAAGRLDDRLAEAACAHFGARRGAWVDPGSALDLQFDGKVPAVDGWESVDLLPITPGPRRRLLLVADMDSTMIGQECIDELADYAGVKPQVAAITERAMQGELDFAGALRERVALLAGLDEAVIALCLAERVRPNPGAATLIATMRAHGARCLLVSGGFTAFAEPVGKMLGFNQVRANVLAVRDGKLVGTVDGAIVDASVKRATLIEACATLGIARNATMALGDGANDKAMVEAAGWGIAYRAKPALAEVADARVDYHGLDALLWAQGIPRAEWIEV